MSLIRSFIRMFVIGDHGDPPVVDHIPVTGTPDWRAAKLKDAATKYGRPFKCAASELPREVHNGEREFVTAQAGKEVRHRPQVTDIASRRKVK
jgi:hypothetical protein